MKPSELQAIYERRDKLQLSGMDVCANPECTEAATETIDGQEWCAGHAAELKQLERCPRCGKLGRKEEANGKTYYAHWAMIDDKSDPVYFGFKHCPYDPSDTKA